MPAFVRYPLLGCLALSLIACGSSGSQTLIAYTPTGGTTPDVMRGAILNIYRATTEVVTTDSSYRVRGTGANPAPNNCDGSLICTRYEDSGTGIVIKSTHKAGASETPEGFGTSFRSDGVSKGIQLGRVTATSKTGTDMDVDVMTTYFAGWLQNSFFAIVLDEFEEGEEDQRIVTAFSQGEATTTNPTALSGYNLTWEGRLFGLGHTTDENMGVLKNHHIRGDVKIDVDGSTMDVAFSKMVDLNNPINNSALDDNDWTWEDLSLTGGGFDGGDLDAQFYGDNHLEVGGTFDRHGVIGAFGAKRIKSTTTP